MVAIQITFSDVASRDANFYASKLRNELLNLGIQGNSILIERSNPEHMDSGSILQMTVEGLQGLAATYSCFTAARLLLGFSFRHHCVLNIRSRDGDINIATNKIDVDGLASVLKKIAEVSRDK